MNFSGFAAKCFLLLLLSALSQEVASQTPPCNKLKEPESPFDDFYFQEAAGEITASTAATTKEYDITGYFAGKARALSDGAADDSYTLKLQKLNENYTNGFDPLEFMDIKIVGGKAIVYMKKAIDRELFAVKGTGLFEGTTEQLKYSLAIHCEPDNNLIDGSEIHQSFAITDQNDNSPVFFEKSALGANDTVSVKLVKQTKFSVQINELTPIDALVIQSIVINDMDDPGAYPLADPAQSAVNAYIRVATDSTDLQPQTRTSSVVVLKKQYDFERMTDNPFTIKMIANDMGAVRRTSTALISVTITDGDDLPPMFVYTGCKKYKDICINPTYTTTVASGKVATGDLGIQPAAIFARDRDTLGYNITYSLVAGKPTNFAEYFTIDDITGTVQQIKAMERTVIPTFELVIQAQEQPPSGKGNYYFATAMLYADVQSGDQYAPVLSSNLGSVAGFVRENAPAGTLVRSQDGNEAMQILIADKDILSGENFGNYAYSVLTPNAQFEVDNDGYVRVKKDAVLDYEVSKDNDITFKVKVEETDTTTKMSAEIDLKVRLLDVNDNRPNFPATDYSFTVKEGDGTRNVGTPVIASDADTQSTFKDITYSLLESPGFQIDPNTAQIQATVLLVRGDKHVLTVRATDKDTTATSRFADVSVVVTVVMDKNKAPEFGAAKYSYTLSEATDVGTAFGSITATDVENNALTYALEETTDFAVNPSSGLLSVAKILDRETKALHQFKITAKDATNAAVTANVEITLTDVNDNNPTITIAKSIYTIEENHAPLPFKFATFTVADIDAGDNAVLDFSLVQQSGAFFTVNKIDANNGDIQLNKAFDFETQQLHNFTLVVSDRGATKRNAIAYIVVNVEDKDDRAPYFPDKTETVYMAENTGVGTKVATVVAVDEDQTTANSIIYQIIGGNTGGVFEIDPATGVIKTKLALDFETSPQYTLTVSTAERGKGHNSAVNLDTTVIVKITDVNDNSPIFTNPSATATVKETEGIGFKVTQVVATDEDSGINAFLVYSITNSQNLFRVGRHTGDIFIKNSLLQTEPSQRTR